MKIDIASHVIDCTSVWQIPKIFLWVDQVRGTRFDQPGPIRARTRPRAGLPRGLGSVTQRI